MGCIVTPLTIIKQKGMVCYGSSSGSLRAYGLKSREQSSFRLKPLSRWTHGIMFHFDRLLNS